MDTTNYQLKNRTLKFIDALISVVVFLAPLGAVFKYGFWVCVIIALLSHPVGWLVLIAIGTAASRNAEETTATA